MGNARRWRGAWLAAGLMVLLSQAVPAATAAPASVVDGLAPLPDDTRPSSYRLAVTLDTEHSRYSVDAVLGFEVSRPTSKVVLNARDLEIDAARLSSGVSGDEAGGAGIHGTREARISYDTARQQVTFDFGAPLSKGAHTLSLRYSKDIGEQTEGLFKVRYPGADGVQQQAYYTFMCCIAAGRLFMPLWDRPDLKAVFDLQLTLPEGLDAVSNMPIARRESLGDGRERIQFQRTPKMSSYLLFFAAGKFDHIVTKAGATEVGVFTQRGKGEQARFALEVNTEVLGYYNEYFATPYPLPKLDSITFPSAGGGAMENWGAIFYYEHFLLMDPALSTAQDRQTIYSIVAHEVAHQWFGNLVTTRGWEDLWLNEGFASWMAAKVAHVFHPEWGAWLHSAASRESAMRLDASAATHPIVRKVATLEEAELAFDDITYEKGSQVIRMLEAYVGEDAFRTAIREHIRQHAYGNAVTGDLWRALEAAAPLPVAAIARDFTEQDGVPLIDVVSTQCRLDRQQTRVVVRQGRFGLDESSKRARDWHVPVTAKVVGNDRTLRQVVRGAADSELTLPGCGAVKLNAGESGYFRTRYDAVSFGQLASSFTRLPAADQLGLLNDSYSLGEAGYSSFEDYLRLVAHLTPAADPVVQLQFARAAQKLDHLYSGLPEQERFRVYARAKLTDLFKPIGWTARRQDTANTNILRAELIDALATLRDDATLSEARRRFYGAARSPDLWSTETRQAIIDAVGMGADEAVFKELTGRASRSNDTREQHSYLLAAARALDPRIARQALAFSLDQQVPEQLTFLMVGAVAETHPELAVDFTIAHYDVIAPRLESFAQVSFVPMLAAKGVDAGLIRKLDEFARQRLGDKGRESVERARSLLTFNDTVRRERLPKISAWVATWLRQNRS